MAPSRAFALTCLLALVAAASGAGDFGLPAPFDDSPNATDVTANVTAQGRHLLDGSVANTTATCPTALEARTKREAGSAAFTRAFCPHVRCSTLTSCRPTRF